MFETASIPSDWAARCNEMDEIWVPTAFHVESFAAAGVVRSKLVVMPEPVDVGRFDPSSVRPDSDLSSFPIRPITGSAAGLGTRFKFLSIFKWESRKGWDVLLAAFVAAFSADDNVALVQ